MITRSGTCAGCVWPKPYPARSACSERHDKDDKVNRDVLQWAIGTTKMCDCRHAARVEQVYTDHALETVSHRSSSAKQKTHNLAMC